MHLILKTSEDYYIKITELGLILLYFNDYSITVNDVSATVAKNKKIYENISANFCQYNFRINEFKIQGTFFW